MAAAVRILERDLRFAFRCQRCLLVQTVTHPDNIRTLTRLGPTAPRSGSLATAEEAGRGQRRCRGLPRLRCAGKE